MVPDGNLRSPCSVGMEEKTGELGWFLREGHFGTISQIFCKCFAIVLAQIFVIEAHKYMQCVDANIWMAYKHVWHIITFTETRTKQDFPQSVRAFSF